MINNMNLNPFAIPPFVSSILILLMGLFVLKKNTKSLTNIGFALLSLALFIWLISDAFLYCTSRADLLSIFSGLVYVGVTALPITGALFIHGLLKRDFQKDKVFFTVLALVYCVTIYFLVKTPYVVSGYYKYYWGYYPKAGNFHFLYLILWISLYFRNGYLAYIHGYKNKSGLYTREECNRIKYGFWVVVFGCIGIIDFLAKYGIEVYPPGYIIIPIFFIITAYSIIKHNVMDIDIVLQKSFVYSALIALITATYFVFVFLAERLFQGMVGYQSLIVSIIYAFAIALFFNPAKNKIQHFADRIFLGKDPIEIARENELMRQELTRSERLKAVATFASGMAHEIKNPLTSIKTFAEYLPSKKNDPEFLNKFSKIVSGEVNRIDSLVHQLLDFAKPAPLNLQSVDIHRLLDDVLGVLSNDFLKHKIKVVKDYTEGATITRIDSNQIKQAFLNLFLNSIDAMSSGGTLTVSIKSGSKSAVICVKDTGCGISEKDLLHIFEPFYSKKENEAGLGLSIVYNIIKEHKGSIKVESKVGEGARFTIEIPINKKL